MTANSAGVAQAIDVDTATLRKAIQDEYREVAEHPDKGFHFHTGRHLTRIVGYKDVWFIGVSERAIESFAGTGNPFAMGELAAGEKVVDVGSGGGIDSLVAARMVGPTGSVVGVDMTRRCLGGLVRRPPSPVLTTSSSARPTWRNSRYRRLGRCRHLERRAQSDSGQAEDPG